MSAWRLEVIWPPFIRVSLTFSIQPAPSDWARRRKVDDLFSDLRTEQVAWLGTYSMLLVNMRRPADDPIADEDDGDIVGLDPEVGMAPAATGSSVSAPP